MKLNYTQDKSFWVSIKLTDFPFMNFVDLSIVKAESSIKKLLLILLL